MISYYELLGMIKDGKAPNKIRVHLTSEPREYKMIFDCGECNYYELIGNENNDYKYYLADSYLESMMFDETIEILDKKGIDKLNLDKEKLKGKETPRAIDYLIESKVNEIIDFLNKEE